MPGFAQPGPGQHPDLTETAVLPHTEGPPLVRPYIPSMPMDGLADPYAQAPADPYAQPPADPYATTVLPPTPPVDPYATAVLPPTPPAEHYSQPPADPYATAVLPPVAANPVAPAQAGHAAPPQPPLMPQAPPSALPPRELGLFPIADSQDGARGRAAARGAARGATQRRTGVIAAAGAGVVALGVALAYVLSPGSSSNDQALPVQPTGAATPSSQPSDSASPSSSAPSTAPSSASAAPATSAKPAAPTTKAAPKTTAPAAPKTTAPAPPPPPPTTQAPPPPPPTTAAPSATTLTYGDSGPAVAALQKQLRAAGCGGRSTGNYDERTVNAVANFQMVNNLNVTGDADPQTQAALNSGATCGGGNN